MKSTNDILIKLLLKHSHNNEINSYDIADYLNLKLNPEFPFTSQKVRSLINSLRVENYPIIANSKGYYMSYDPEDIMDQYISLRGRIDSIENSMNGLLRVYSKITNKDFDDVKRLLERD